MINEESQEDSRPKFSFFKKKCLLVHLADMMVEVLITLESQFGIQKPVYIHLPILMVYTMSFNCRSSCN